MLAETVDSYEGTLGGIAYSQTVPAGSFTAAGIAGNTYVIGLQGFDVNYLYQTVDQLTLAAAGTVSGFVDFNDLTLLEPASPDPVAAVAYTMDAAGAGDVTIAGLSDDTAVTYNLQLYLDGNGHALAITLDGGDALGGPGFQQSGTGAFAATSFNGPYAMGATGWDVNGYGELDSAGPVVADGVGTFGGFGDVNWWGPPVEVSGSSISGAFTSNADGIFTGTVTGLDVTDCTAFTPAGAGCSADVFNYYLVDATGDNIAIETDANQLTLGYFVQQ